MKISIISDNHDNWQLNI